MSEQERPQPLFSIVIVTLNARPFVAEALESVARQTLRSFELLVVDGGSTDGTIDDLRAYDARLEGRMRWMSEPDGGLYDAMNKGLAAASGRYLAYLGADDRLAPGALEAVERAVRVGGGATIVAGAVRVFGGASEWIELPRSYARMRVPKRAPARHQALFVERRALADAGGFDTRYRIAADYDLYLRLCEVGATESLTNDILAEFRLGGVSSANVVATAREYRDIRVAHGSGVLWQRLVMAKSLAAATVVGAVRGVGSAKRGDT